MEIYLKFCEVEEGICLLITGKAKWGKNDGERQEFSNEQNLSTFTAQTLSGAHVTDKLQEECNQIQNYVMRLKKNHFSKKVLKCV